MDDNNGNGEKPEVRIWRNPSLTDEEWEKQLEDEPVIEEEFFVYLPGHDQIPWDELENVPIGPGSEGLKPINARAGTDHEAIGVNYELRFKDGRAFSFGDYDPVNIVKMAIYKRKLIYVAIKYHDFITAFYYKPDLQNSFFDDIKKLNNSEYSGHIPIDKESEIEYLYTPPFPDDRIFHTLSNYKTIEKMAMYKEKRIFIEAVWDEYYLAGFFGSHLSDGFFVKQKELHPLEYWGKIPVSEKCQIQFLDDIED